MNNKQVPLGNEAASDPTSDAAGASPVGSSTSAAAGGAVVGAVAGTVVAGPIGTVVGAALGAIAASLGGLSDAEPIDPTQEEAYWRENFAAQPYVEKGSSFDDYGPAYAYGVSAYIQNPGRSYDDCETDMARGWSTARGISNLAWDRARNAARDAWDRVSDAAGAPPPAQLDRDSE